jgi:hypothetical protein
MVGVEDLPDIFSIVGGGQDDARAAREVSELAKELYTLSVGNAGGRGTGRKCVPYDELQEALLLTDAEFKTRFPGHSVRKAGATLLYERLADRKATVVVGHKAPQGKEEMDDGKGGPKERFMALCRRLDRRRTGAVT